MAWSTIDCAEEAWSRRENFARDGGPSFSVVLRCAGVNRYALLNDILGTPRGWPSSPFTGVYAQSASAVPAPNTSYVGVDQQCSYDEVLVTVNYGMRTGVDIISEVIEPSVEFRTLDPKRFRWGSKTGDPLLQGEAPGTQVRGFSISRTFYNIAAVHNSYLTLGGKTNQAQYVSALLGLTFPVETLMFTPGPIQRTIRTDGTDGYTVQTKFTYNKDGWNKHWRAKSSAYEEIFDVESGTAHKNYPPTDLSAWLF